MRILRRFLGSLILTAAVLAAVVACQDLRNGQGAEWRPPPEGAVRIATYNVHYIDMRADGGRWSLEGWEDRKEPLALAVGSLDADIIAFQEMETFAGGNDDRENLARSFLLERHPGYAVAAMGDWREFPSTQPIFYRQERFDVTDQGWFFFSETPDVIYSRTFNGSYPAFASWARFRERGGGPSFRVVNVHTDYASSENRTRSVDLIVERIAPWVVSGEAVFLAGDLNARLGSPLHERLEVIGLSFVPVRGATYHLDFGLNLFGAIDHIGYAGADPAGEPMVMRRKFDDVWPTDHYPMAADFLLPE